MQHDDVYETLLRTMLILWGLTMEPGDFVRAYYGRTMVVNHDSHGIFVQYGTWPWLIVLRVYEKNGDSCGFFYHDDKQVII